MDQYLVKVKMDLKILQNKGLEHGDDIFTFWETYKFLELKENEIFINISELQNDSIMFANDQLPSEYLLHLPKKRNFYRNIPYSNRGTVFFKSGTMIITMSSFADNKNNLFILLAESMKKSLKNQGIIINEEKWGDIIIQYNNTQKKVGGVLENKFNFHRVYGAFISFDVEYDEMDKLYNFKSEKFTKKGDISSTTDILIGLNEVKNIDKEKLKNEIINNLAKSIKAKKIPYSLSSKEFELFAETKKQLLSNDFIFKAKSDINKKQKVLKLQCPRIFNKDKNTYPVPFKKCKLGKHNILEKKKDYVIDEFTFDVYGEENIDKMLNYIINKYNLKIIE